MPHLFPKSGPPGIFTWGDEGKLVGDDRGYYRLLLTRNERETTSAKNQGVAMSMTDPIADLLTRIRNSITAKHDRLNVPMSKVKLAICKILEEEGLISSCKSIGDNSLNQQIQVILRYSQDGESAIRRIQRVSKPGRRVYRRASEIRPVLSGLGVGILSTSKGLVTDKKARELKVGGEVLCEIW